MRTLTSSHLRSGSTRKSRGEQQLARFLDRAGLDYFYEHPLAVIDRGKTRIWYPDFWLPEQGVLLEYAGVAHDASYTQRIEHKKGVYANMGLPALFLDPGFFAGYWPARILESLATIQEDRLAKVRNAMDQLLAHTCGSVQHSGGAQASRRPGSE